MKRIAHNVGGQILVLLIAFWIPGELCARQDAGEMQEVGLESGALSDLREAVGKLLVLDIDDRRRLHLATALWSQYKQSAAERKNKKFQKLVESGMTKEQALRWAGDDESSVQDTNSSFIDAVSEITSLMGSGSSGSSGSGSTMALHQENEYMGLTASANGNAYHFTMTEFVRSKRFLKLSDSGNGQFELTLTGPAHLINLQQSPTGELFVGMIVNETAFGTKTSGYREFATKHPEQFQTITKILQHIGIQCPPMPGDPQVAMVVHRLLGTIHGETPTLFVQLVAGLDSDDFSTREKSKASLNDSWEQNRDLIEAAVASSNYSPEVHSALTAIMDANEKVTNDSRYENLVVREKLLSSPEYLVNLLNTPGDYATGPLIKQLGKITGQNLGDDAQAWNDWLKLQPGPPEPDRR